MSAPSPAVASLVARADWRLILLGYLACQVGAGTYGLASVVVFALRGELEAGPAAITLVVGLVVFLVFGLLLRIGVRRWVLEQPPDPPGGGG